MIETLVRIKGREGAFRLRADQSHANGRWLDAWSLDTAGMHSAHPEDLRRLCGPCTTRLDTGRRIPEACPTCDSLAVTP